MNIASAGTMNSIGTGTSNHAGMDGSPDGKTGSLRWTAKSCRIAAFLLILLLPALSCRFVNMGALEITDWSPRKPSVPSGEAIQIWIAFSAPMERAKAEEAFSLRKDGQRLAGIFQWREETLRFSPYEAVSAGHSYIMAVTTRAEDLYGNSLTEDFSFGFQIGSDRAQPALISYSPSDHEVTDDLHQTVTFSFSEPIDRQSLYDGFSLTPTAEGTFTWSDGDRTVSFTPLSRLQWQQEYTVSVSDTVADLHGNRIVQPHTSRFRIGSDTVPPAVTSLTNTDETYPLVPYDETAGHVNEGWESAWGFRMRFSEPLDRDSLKGALAIEPDWDFHIDWPDPTSTDEATLIPDEGLRYGELYTLCIKEGLSDLYGNPMASEIRCRILVNGPGSKPPEIARTTFLTVPGSADPNHIVELADFSLIDLSGYSSPAQGFFDIYLGLAEGCSGDLPSFMQSFSVSCTNSCADLLPIAVVQSSDTALSPPAHPEPGADLVVIRVYMTIEDNPGNNGTITLELSRNFQDSADNTLDENWQLMLVK